MSVNERALTAEEADALDRFKALLEREAATEHEDDKLDPPGEQDWYSLSLGFFSALGLAPLSAHHVACHARYRLEYWGHPG